jgi:hypothetical protein
VVKSLQLNGFDRVFHVHHYDENGIPIPTHLSHKDVYNIKNPLIITIVRDPVIRNLSSFWHRQAYYMSPHVRRINPSIELKTQFFLKLFRHDYILTWFDDEFKQNIGIDIYKDKSNNVIIFKTEELNKNFEEFTLKYFNTKISLTYSERDLKPYAGMLDYLPEEYFHKMYNSKYSKHFYG